MPRSRSPVMSRVAPGATRFRAALAASGFLARAVAVLGLASTFLGTTPACAAKCEDIPGRQGFGITPETFHAGSREAGDAQTFQEWYAHVAGEPCEQACTDLVGVEPITVSSCATTKENDDAGVSTLSVICEYVHHSCDQNPGCGG